MSDGSSGWKTWAKRGGLVLIVLVAIGAGVVFQTTRLTRDPNELAVGAAVPAPTLVAADGTPFSFPTARPLVLVFYRGHW